MDSVDIEALLDRESAATEEQVPLVSIAIACFNQSRFLADAIISALAQTANAIEIIVIDDGSTDNPAAVVVRFPGVRLIRQENQGLSGARNTGLRESRGRYVMFLDADDRLLPEAVAVNLDNFGSNPSAAFVHGGYRWIDVDGRPSGVPVVNSIAADAYETLLRGNRIGMHATVMYRRDLLEEIGGFDIHLKACEDYDLYLRLARTHRIVSSPEVVAEYRLHSDNMSKNTPLMLETVLEVLRRQRPHLARDPSRSAAYANGLHYVTSLYVGQQMRQIREHLSGSDGWGKVFSDSIKVFAFAPRIFASAALHAVSSRLRARIGRHSGEIEFGGLRRITPISNAFGYDRGRPVDRRYIEEFLAEHADDIRGRVLEIGDNTYTQQFARNGQVTQSDVLHVAWNHSRVTFIGDLADGHFLPSNTFDCIVLTQTLHLIFDIHKALETLHRILKPGGVLLITVPGVSSVDHGEWGSTWFWSFTPASIERLLEVRFGGQGASVRCYGNVLAATAFLYGLAEHELTAHELGARDPHYPVIVVARAIKRSA
jgi:glycosyltransferase involved in cell wall biosynthesis/SAM-dependent methyltransferase